MKKIAIIVPSLSGGGGAERTAALLANGLCESSFEVCIYSLVHGESAYILNNNVGFVKIDDSTTGNVVTKNIKRIHTLKKCLQTKRPDLIIGYTIQGGIFACILSKMLRIKAMVCERQDPYQFSLVMRKLRDHLYKKADAAVFQTTDAQKYFSKIVKKSCVIPNFIDVSAMPEVVPWEQREKKIVNTGRLVNAKDQLTLMKAFSKISSDFPEYSLEIYGDGPLYDTLDTYIQEQGLTQRIKLCGRRDNIFDCIKKAELFVLSSKYEGYPNALLEAMALGLSCISTDCPCGGPRAMISSGENGELVPLGDADAMAEALQKLLRDKALMEHYSTKAVEMRIKNDKRTIIKKWISFIDEVIKEAI